MRRLILAGVLLAAGCASAETIRQSEPVWTGEYRSPIKPFAQCVQQAIQGELTVKLVFETQRAARLSAYYHSYGTSMLYEVLLTTESNDLGAAEMRISPVNLAKGKFIGEVSEAVDRCEQQT